MEAEAETKVVDRDPSPEVSPTSPPQAPTIDLNSKHRLVGRYELIHRLGHGGMATVYLGRAIGKAGFERLVAVKVIHPHLANEPEFVEMFLDEARIAAKIHHPHVVEILDLGDEDDVFFMVMEYVEGDTLSSLIRQLRRADELLPLPAILRIVADACQGLAAAHDLVDRDDKQLELVHRDVSPHNLLVSMDGRVKVVDFGIMKAAGKRSSTLTGQLRGKLAYMAPEQARRKSVDRRTDIFALGAVLWELCTNNRLYDAEGESETLEQVLRCEVPDLRDFRDDLPDEVDRIIRKALAQKPDDRYESAQEMLKDLRSLDRQIAGDEDARDILAAAMDRFFSGRVEYIRATLRGSSLSGRKRRSTTHDLQPPSASSSAQSESNTMAIGGSSSVAARMLTPATQTQTLTTSLAGAPARHWTLWLLLPLVGAAIGTAAMGWDRPGDETDATQPAAIVQPKERSEPDPTPASALAPKAGTVKWLFNTQPQGATIVVDGQPLEKTTPVSIELARSEKEMVIRIHKEGYEPKEMTLAPLRPDNFNTRLDRIKVDEDPIPPSKHVGPKKIKGKAKPPSDSEGGDDGGATKPKGPSDERDFPDIPGVAKPN